MKCDDGPVWGETPEISADISQSDCVSVKF